MPPKKFSSELDPLEIYFTHRSVVLSARARVCVVTLSFCRVCVLLIPGDSKLRREFSTGQPVEETLAAIERGDITVDDIPRIQARRTRLSRFGSLTAVDTPGHVRRHALL